MRRYQLAFDGSVSCLDERAQDTPHSVEAAGTLFLKKTIFARACAGICCIGAAKEDRQKFPVSERIVA